MYIERNQLTDTAGLSSVKAHTAYTIIRYDILSISPRDAREMWLVVTSGASGVKLCQMTKEKW